ncbi:MAG: ATP-binding cassette domain-containing protein [Clostridiales bacterium]|nr:ATP-binding cassette domain-containing protein [Clostridiales bacterium]
MEENKEEKKSVIKRVKDWYRHVTHKDDPHYISGKEQRLIAKNNRKTTRAFEKKKLAHVSESDYVTQMRDPSNILEVDGLCTYFFTDAGVSKAVDGVSFDIPKSSIVGVVGESGCGKSVTSLSVMQLVQAPQGQIVSGSIRFNTQDYKKGEDGKPIPIWEYEEVDGERVIKTKPKLNKKGKPVLDNDGKPVMVNVQALDGNGFPAFEMEDKVFDIAKMPTRAMQRIRGKEIAMIFQEPMTSLNPLFTIGNQLDEVVLLHTPGADKELAHKRTIEMLQLVGIAMPEIVYKRFPHELSGGMRQRVMIAMALACNPKLIVADEPTTALDVTIQAQVLDLLKDIKTKINGSIMIITHDLGVIASMADYVVVMYAGRVIEKGTVEDIFDTPLHPYTVGLQKSKPVINRDVEELYSIKGQVPNPIDMPKYCYFKDRCESCIEDCNGEYPPLVKVSDTHYVACYCADEARMASINAKDRALKEKAESEALKAQQAEQATTDDVATTEQTEQTPAEASDATQAESKPTTKSKKTAKEPNITIVKKTTAAKSKTTSTKSTATKTSGTKKDAKTSGAKTATAKSGGAKSATSKTGGAKSTAAKSSGAKKSTTAKSGSATKSTAAKATTAKKPAQKKSVEKENK